MWSLLVLLVFVLGVVHFAKKEKIANQAAINEAMQRMHEGEGPQPAAHPGTSPYTANNAGQTVDTGNMQQLVANIEQTVSSLETALQHIKQDVGELKQHIAQCSVAATTQEPAPSTNQALQAHPFVSSVSAEHSFTEATEQQNAYADSLIDDAAAQQHSSFAQTETTDTATLHTLDEATTTIADDNHYGAEWKHEYTEEAAAYTAAPQEPSFLEKAWEGICALKISRFISASNIWVLAGIAILLVGVVFLVSYAAQFSQVTIEMRLGFAGLVGFILLVIGWRQRNTHRELGLILQGGGVGALYLTIIAGVQLYHIIPSAFAFVALVAIVAFSTFLSVVQYSKIMAHVSYVAGFLAPILVSSGSNNYIALFSFYMVLNLGIIGVSRFRDWKSLHLTGLLFTATIGGLWGQDKYLPEFFTSIECFLVAFYLLFTCLAVTGGSAKSFTLKDKRSALVDVPLTFGTPLLFILFQAAIVQDKPFVLAFTALAMGAIYLAVTLRLRNKWVTAKEALVQFTANAEDANDNSSFIVAEENADSTQSTVAALSAHAQETAAGIFLKAQIYLVLGVVFANLAIPLALFELSLDHWRERMLALVWAVEGASLYWLGWRQQLKVCRWLGIGSFVLSLVCLFAYIGMAPLDQYYAYDDAGQWELLIGKLATSVVLLIMQSAAFLVGAYAAWQFWQNAEAEHDEGLENTAALTAEAGLWYKLFGWGALAVFAGTSLLEAYSFDGVIAYCEKLFYIYLAGSLVARFTHMRIPLPALRWFMLCPVVPFAGLLVIFSFNLIKVYFYTLSMGQLLDITLPSLLVMLAYALAEMYMQQKQQEDTPFVRVSGVILAVSLVPLATLCCIILRGNSLSEMFTWWRIILFVCPAIAVFSFKQWATARAIGATNWVWWSSASAAWLALWLVTDFFALGDPYPLPFIPLLNPLEISIALSITLLVLWSRALATIAPIKGVVQLLTRVDVFGAVLFCLMNFSVARACTMYTDMPFSFSGAVQSSTCQALLAILWAVSGSVAMYCGNKLYNKNLWLFGGALMLADVAKLFFLDLTRLETVWRIVAFMLVGLLLIMIGYFFPLPPSKKLEEPTSASDDEPLVDAVSNDAPTI